MSLGIIVAADNHGGLIARKIDGKRFHFDNVDVEGWAGSLNHVSLGIMVGNTVSFMEKDSNCAKSLRIVRRKTSNRIKAFLKRRS